MIVGPLASLALKANATIEYDPTCDMQITNVALDGTSVGRTVVKIHYIETSPYEDDSDFSDDDEEDDDEQDEDEDEDAADLKADKLDREPVGEERTIVLCSLYPQTLEQVTVNFVLPEGEAVEFIVEGPNNVHILGNYINQPVDAPPRDDYDDEFGSDLSSDEGGLYDPETGLPMLVGSDDDDEDSLDDDEDGMSEDEDAAARFEELKESPAKPKAKASALLAETAKPAAEDASMEIDGLSKNQRKKLLKKAKADAASAAAGVPAAKSDVQNVVGKKEEKVTLDKSGKKTDEVKTTAQVTVNGAEGKDVKATAKKQSKKTTLASGVIIEDIKMGDGPAATAGKKVSMRYIGKLQNGKQFDANTKGKPFEFKLGKGEGMDAGVEGMRPGGERRLTIPPSQAYGKAGTDGIPANSVLIFELKLLSMK